MTLMMKKIFNFLIIGALLLMASCQKPEHVLPTADRQGITSITAIFTWGPNQDEEMVKYLISDDKADEYIVPIPWYFPEETTDETTVYMSKIRLTAELEPNCILEPSIGSQIWDFSKGQKYELHLRMPRVSQGRYSLEQKGPSQINVTYCHSLL